MSRPRPILAGRTYSVSRRVTQREFLLRPDDKVTNAVRYLVAYSAKKFNVGVIAVVAMSNHLHLVVHDFDGVLPSFLQHLHSLLGRVLNRARGRWENFWSVEEANYNHLVELGDEIAKTVYVLANPVEAHLVDRAGSWPGFTTFGWLDGRTVTAERPAWFFKETSKLPPKVEMRLVKPPSFPGAFAEWAEVLRAGVAEEERKAAATRERTGQRVLGRKAVRRTSPNTKPQTPAPRGRLRPFIAAKNFFARSRALDALEEFRRSHAFARAMFKLGWRDVPFPAGTWAMAQLAGVHVAQV